MSTALEAASLIMIPTSYSDGLLASVKPNDGAGDFTFTRGSNISATRINADGNIEKGYENLLTYSNDFSQWTKSGITATSGQSGYDGSSDAWIITKSGGAFDQILRNVSSSGVNTISFYAKAGTFTSVYFRGQASSNIPDVKFNLSDGSLTTSNNVISASSDDIGSGWYRLKMTFSNTITNVTIYPDFGQTTAGTIYIQDAMINQGLVSYPYVETTTAPVAAGILEDTPRIDFPGGNQSLLLEPSRTNLVPYSEYFSSWQPVGSPIITENTTETLSPEGRYNATKIVGDGNNGIYKATLSTAGGNNVKSIYIKGINGGETCALRDPNQSNVVTTCNITTEWQRFECVDNQTSNMGIWLDNVPASGIYIWGAQLEQDAAYPTSYIPTYGVSQTRLGDVLGNSNNISGLFNDNKGTLYLETDDTIFKGEINNYNFFGLTESSSGSYFRFRGSNSTILAQSGGFGSTISFNPNGATFTKYLYKWDGTNIKIFIDGVERGSVSQTATFNPDLFRIGFNFGFVSNTKQLLVFPTALSDSECIELTTV